MRINTISGDVEPIDFINIFKEKSTGRNRIVDVFGDFYEDDYLYYINDMNEDIVSSRHKLKPFVNGKSDIVYIDVQDRQNQYQEEIISNRKANSQENWEEEEQSSSQPPEFKQFDNNNRMHGPAILYDNDGYLEQMGNYDHGVRVGAWNMYDSDGSINSSELFENDQKTGPWVIFYKNGVVNAQPITKMVRSRKRYNSNHIHIN